MSLHPVFGTFFIFLALTTAQAIIFVEHPLQHPAAFDSHPWLLSIIDHNGAPVCSASLFEIENKKYPSLALTAAHCVCGENAKEERYQSLKVRVAKHDLLGGVYQVNIKSVYCHRSYRKADFTSDIALIKFDQSLKLWEGGTVGTIRLATSKDDLKNGKDCKIVGWGIAGYSKDSIPVWANELQEMQVEKSDFVKSGYGPSMFSAKYVQEPSAVGCGDSGTPMICNVGEMKVIVGTVSCGPNEKDIIEGLKTGDYYYWVNVLEDVSIYYPWIKATARLIENS